MPEHIFDISIVLNLHNEAPYLRRTLRSLEEAVLYAQRYNITLELVIVLDRPDAATKQWVENYNYSTFNGRQIVLVDNGSLGPSRNDGIENAKGEYIAIADGDDLISFNSFSESYPMARGDPRGIFLPQYLFAFGSSYHLWEYFGSDSIANTHLFDKHPYISRIFAHKNVFSQLKYGNASLLRGEAYEDWLFSCDALTLGFRFAIVPNTIFFYRQRQNSLMRTSSDSLRIIPYSRFFRAPEFIKAAGGTPAKSPNTPMSTLWQDVQNQIIVTSEVSILVAAANKIDPAISYQRLASAPVGTNIPIDDEVGKIYYRLCKLIGDRQFTDVILLPFLTTGGADKFLLQVINGLASIDAGRSFVVLSGQAIDKHQWTDRLPKSSLHIDLYQACIGQPSDRLHLIALRIIQSCASKADIHIKSCEFANEFLRRHAIRLINNKLTFYYFCDNITRAGGLSFVDGFNFDFVSEMQNRLTRLISDHVANLDTLSLSIDHPLIQRETLYAVADSRSSISAIQSPKPTILVKWRLLWASRLDSQKRPDLLLKIGSALVQSLPKLTIDVFGSPVLDAFDVGQFNALTNLRYKGAYSEFDALAHRDYDAFLYTASFDGLPNVILEAMAAGLPVIAPDVGGISEAVTADTGFLLENSPDDEVLVQRYVRAIKELYADAKSVVAKLSNAQKLIHERHSEVVFLKRLAEIFDLNAHSDHLETAE